MSNSDLKEYRKQYYLKNREKLKEYMKKYYENNKNKMLNQMKEWKDNHPEYNKKYYEKNIEQIKKHLKQYNKTKIGRAIYLVARYKASDKKHNRADCTLTAKWVVENIFSSKCCHCGETDWHKLGCDRIDNSKPHTPDNVVCSCGKCNIKKH